MIPLSDIVGITVVYNTPALIKQAIESIRRYYPDLHIMVVNLSTDNYKYRFINASVYNIRKNKGHGWGLNFALKRTSAKYALCFDSDIIMRQAPIDYMMKQFKDDTYGVGHVSYVNEFGNDVQKSVGFPYLHPHFMMVDVEKYKLWPPFINHGAPCLKTMIAIRKKRLHNKILVNFDVKQFVQHLGRGTRKLRPLEFHPRNWDKV